MMNILITIAITAIFFTALQEYRHKVIKPVRYEQKPPIMESWQDFITANINSCFTAGHCLQCQELIKLFITKFINHVPAELFLKDIENMWNKLDTKYKAIQREDEMSEVTVDSLIN